MQTQASGGLEPTKYNGRAKDARPSTSQLGAGGWENGKFCIAKSQTSRVMFRTRDPSELLRERNGQNTWPGGGLLSDTSVARWPEQIPEAPSFKLSEEEEEETGNPERGGLKAEHVKVYPNPFQNTFTVQYEFADDVKELRLEVFDLTGRRVKDLMVQHTRTGSQSLGLDGCKGLYLLRVSADNRMVRTEKLICLER